MMCLCAICDQPCKQDEQVYIMILAPFKALKSNVHFAVGTPTWADPETLCHKECYECERDGGLDA